jgi:hypothetical protein
MSVEARADEGRALARLQTPHLDIGAKLQILFIKNLVDRDHRQGTAAAGIVDAGYRVDGLVDQPYREPMPGRDHARRARPRVGRGITDFLRTKHAAEIVHPAFTAENVDLAADGHDAGA